MIKKKNFTHHQHLRWFQHETFVGSSSVASGSFSKTETHISIIVKTELYMKFGTNIQQWERHEYGYICPLLYNKMGS